MRQILFLVAYRTIVGFGVYKKVKNQCYRDRLYIFSATSTSWILYSLLCRLHLRYAALENCKMLFLPMMFRAKQIQDTMNMNHRNMVFSIGRDTKQSTTCWHGCLKQNWHWSVIYKRRRSPATRYIVLFKQTTQYTV